MVSNYNKNFALLYSLTLIYVIILSPNQPFHHKMDITLDFTQQAKPKLSDLSHQLYMRSVTFVLPFFKESKSNFSCLWEFISFLNDKPLVKIFVKPHGQNIKPKYKAVAVGGTFDHLHIGHQILLLHTVLSAEKKVIIGVTSEQMLQKKANQEIIQSFLMRINEVREFMRKVNSQIELKFVELTDPYGPTITDPDIDAIIVSEQTLKTVDTINEKRKQKGFHALAIEICPIIAPLQHITSLKQIQNKISSTQLRTHILAKNGFTIQQYIEYEKFWKALIDKINKLSGTKDGENHLLSGKWWDIVVKYYSQYWRFYHTNHHLNQMLKQLKETKEFKAEDLAEEDKVVLDIAIFFHDIIYRPDLKTNQQDSAVFAEAFLQEIWGSNNVEIRNKITAKVKAAILSTKTHQSSNEVEKILNELDMSILDSSLEKYQTYALDIQREYRPLYKESYPKQRVKFLENSLLGYKFNWREGKNMKANIEWEISYWQNKKDEL